MPDELLQFESRPKSKKRPVKAKAAAPAPPPKKEGSALPLLFIIIILAGVGVYWWQGQTVEKTQRDATDTQQELQKKIGDLEKQLELTKEQEPEKVVFAPADCSLLGSPWTTFAPESYSLSFCYKKTWGTPELKEIDTKEEHTGTKWQVKFPQVPYLSVAFETPDFLIPAPEAQTFEKLYTALKKEFEDLKDTEVAISSRTIHTLTVHGKDALRVYRNEVNPKTRVRTKSVQYLIPNAINGEYHLSAEGFVTGNTDLTPVDDSLKTLVDSLVF
ncbi:MAG: hypothetical protein Q7S89_02975 [bacterium]|nr:hypothetical protein [bacterium]